MFELDRNTKLNIYCYLLFGLLFIILLTQYGFGVYFLSNIGLNYSEIGFLFAISALLSACIQPVLGRLIDSHHYSWKNILLVLDLLIIISLVIMFFLPIKAILFAVVIVLAGCMVPLINYAPFYYKNYNYETNFGVSRGFGALSFTIFSSIIGFTITGNVMVLMVFALVSAVIMFFVIYKIPYHGFKSKIKENKKFYNILSKYPMFILILIAMVFLMTFQNLFECYMINILENIGGTVKSVGISNSISAFLEIPVMFLFLKIFSRFNSRNLVIMASIFYVIRAVLIFFAQDPLHIYVSQILQMFSYAIIIPATAHLTVELIDPEDQFEAQAFLAATLTIGLILANVIGGNVIQTYGVNLLLMILVILCIIGCLFAVSTRLFKNNVNG